jgi:mevalonate kinase
MTSGITGTSVCASAPGKAILFGEHAVVYGEPALAAALSDLRIVVLVTPMPKSEGIRIQMPDLKISVDFVISTERILKLGDKLKTPPTPLCAEEIAHVLSECQTDLGVFPLDALSLSALTPLIYLIHQLASETIQLSGMMIHVRSRGLPVGAGLGSSAAFSVASAAALIKLQQQSRNSSMVDYIGSPSKEFLEQINQAAFYSEILLHGTPSGIDNAVSAYGGAILYSKQPGGDVHMDRYPPSLFELFPPLLIVNTNVARSTKELVGRVRRLYETHTDITKPLIHAMGQIAKDVTDRLFISSISATTTTTTTTASSNNKVNSSWLMPLDLVRLNHNLLRAIQVSHPSLNTICDLVDQVANGKAAAKLTGAGGGGCAIVVFANDDDEAATTAVVRQRVQRALQSCSSWTYTCFSSRVGGDGVLWIDPNDFDKQENLHDRNHWMAAASMTAVVALGVSGLAFQLTRLRRS